MKQIFGSATSFAGRWTWLTLLPALAVCSGTTSTEMVSQKPGVVHDLVVSGTTEASATLVFTQVGDGAGRAASYEVRYSAGSTDWTTAISTTTGSCATPITGTTVGASMSCTVLGLSASTSYNFQLAAFRGTLNADATFGDPSNVATASTAAPPSPPPPSPPPPPPPPAPTVSTVTVSPAAVSLAVGATTTLQATVKDAQGNTMSGQTVTWSTNDPSKATVNANGVVTGIAAGSATITATASGKSGASSITVTAPPPPPPVVTTVTVAPSSAAINVGATTQLSATVRDAQGNVMTGQTVTWSTDNSAVAAVNANGLVTGVAAGQATITATCSGHAGTSSLTVSAPPPPPPPPPGGTVLFQENFEDANLASRGWYDNTSVLLSTAEHMTGSASSAQYRFLAGATTPTSGGAQRHKFTPTNTLYVSFYVKYSTNWVGSTKPYHPHEFYILSTLDGDWDGPSQNFLDVYIEQNYQNGGRPRLAMQDNRSVNYNYGALPNNLISVTEDRSTGGCNGVVETNIASECFNAGSYWYNDKQLTGPVTFQPNPGAGYKSDWNFVEAYLQLNTVVNGIGQADGVMQYWFNGTLIIDRHDILFRTGAHANLQFSQFLIAPYIGDGSPVDQSMFVDNLKVATGRTP